MKTHASPDGDRDGDDHEQGARGEREEDCKGSEQTQKVSSELARRIPSIPTGSARADSRPGIAAPATAILEGVLKGGTG